MNTNISYWRTKLGEDTRKALNNAFDNENISQGIITAQLEKKLAGMLDIPYVIATTSGSVALYMAMLALEIKHGDEVIVPNRTFHATAHAVLLTGAKVKIVDTLPDIPLIDPLEIKKKIGSKTKAIIPVHLNGRSVDMKAIWEIANEHNLFIVEDAAQAIFSKNGNGYLGTQSDIGIYSMGMTKMISTGQGGLLVTRSKQLYEKLKLLKNHGVVDTMSGHYLQLGCNFKYTDLLASIGIVQLQSIVQKIDHLIKVQKEYENVIDEFPFLSIIPVRYEKGEIPLWVEVLCPVRKKLQSFLSSNGIETRTFLPNLEFSPHIYTENGRIFPNSKKFHEQGLFLPCGPNQPMENIKITIQLLKKFKSQL